MPRHGQAGFTLVRGVDLIGRSIDEDLGISKEGVFRHVERGSTGIGRPEDLAVVFVDRRIVIDDEDAVVLRNQEVRHGQLRVE